MYSVKFSASLRRSGLMILLSAVSGYVAWWSRGTTVEPPRYSPPVTEHSSISKGRSEVSKDGSDREISVYTDSVTKQRWLIEPIIDSTGGYPNWAWSKLGEKSEEPNSGLDLSLRYKQIPVFTSKGEVLTYVWAQNN